MIIRTLKLTTSNRKQIFNGQVLPIHPLLKVNEKLVFGVEGKAFAVYIKHPTKEGQMKPDKMFPEID